MTLIKKNTLLKWISMFVGMLIVSICLPIFALSAAAENPTLSFASVTIYESDGTTPAAAVTSGNQYVMDYTITGQEPATAPPVQYALRLQPDTAFYPTTTSEWLVAPTALTSAGGSYTINGTASIYYTGASTQSLSLEVHFFDAAGDSVGTQTLTTTIRQAQPTPVSSSTAPPASSEAPVVRGTGFTLRSVSFGDNSVAAGSDFNLNATILSTNGTYDVENVSVEVKPSQQFSVDSGSSIIYIGTVTPNMNIPLSVPLLASAVAEEGSYQVILSVNGVAAHDGTPVNAEMVITIPIYQPERFEFSTMQLPDYLTAGMDDGMGYSSISVVNKGKGIIYNVSVEIVGDGLTTDMGQQYVGNINPGSESGADFNILASVAGNINAQVVVTYENARGEENTLTHDFAIEVVEGFIDPGIDDPFSPGEPIPEEPSGLPIWVYLIIGVVVLGGVITAIVIIAKKRKAKKYALLDDIQDDEEDD